MREISKLEKLPKYIRIKNKKRKKPVELIINLLLLVSTSVVMLLFFEITLRVSYNFFYENIANITAEKRKGVAQIIPFNIQENEGYAQPLNNEGFRDYNFSIIKSNKTRIAVIGDSFTYGDGIRLNSGTYPKILEEFLEKNYPNQFEVYNFGMRGLNIVEIYYVLKVHVEKYSPDIVIYGFFYNDPEFNKYNLDIEYCRNFQPIYKPFTVDFVQIKLNRFILWQKSQDGRNAGSYRKELTAEGYYGWECFKRIVMEFKKESIKGNYTFVYFYIPGYPKDNKEDKWQSDKVDKVFIDAGLNVLKILDYVFEKTKGYNNSEMFISDKNRHYSEKINRIIAEALYIELSNRSNILHIN